MASASLEADDERPARCGSTRARQRPAPGAVCLVCAALLAAVEALTRDTLRDYAEASRRATLAQVLPAGSFDNDVLATAWR